VSEAAGGRPVEDLESVRRELALTSPELAAKPFAVVASKLDAAGGDAITVLRDYCGAHGWPYFEISAATGQGVQALLRAVGSRVARAQPPTPEADAPEAAMSSDVG
jgi:GTP-binding protein